VFAIRSTSGSRRWLYDRTMPSLTLRGAASPILTSTRVFAGMPNGRMVALDRNDGSLVWEARLGVPSGSSDLERMRDIVADPVLFQGSIYAVSFQGMVVSLDPRDGTPNWERELSSNAGLAVDGERVYVTESNGRVWALDRRTGAAIWRQDDTEGLHATAPVVIDDRVAIADDRGAVTVLDASSGEILARRTLSRGDGISRAPVLVEQDLIVLNDNGRLYRLALRAP